MARLRVLIAGAGVAGLEAALALRDLAGDRVGLTLLTGVEDLTYWPLAVAEPFGGGPPRHYPLAPIAADLGAELVTGQLAAVEVPARTVRLASGRTVPFDVLLLALGARRRRRFEHALSVEPETLATLELGGPGHSAAVLVPGDAGWPLPAYEIALLAAAAGVRVVAVTGEEAPLAVFGRAAADAVGGLLEEAGVELVRAADVAVPEPGVVRADGRRIAADQVLALPELEGPAVPGLPHDERGFLPVGPLGQVDGPGRVFAAGDGTDFPIKHGSLASQQAEAAASAIAALAGAEVEPEPFRPVIRGKLLTGGDPLYFEAGLLGRRGFRSVVGTESLWPSGAKISARRLAPYLAERDRG